MNPLIHKSLILFCCLHLITALPFGIFKKPEASDSGEVVHEILGIEATDDALPTNILTHNRLVEQIVSLLHSGRGLNVLTGFFARPAASPENNVTKRGIPNNFNPEELVYVLQRNPLSEILDVVRGAAFISMTEGILEPHRPSSIESLISAVRNRFQESIRLEAVEPASFSNILPDSIIPRAAEELSQIFEGLLSTTLTPIEAIIRFVESEVLDENAAQIVPRIEVLGSNFADAGLRAVSQFEDLVALATDSFFTATTVGSNRSLIGLVSEAVTRICPQCPTQESSDLKHIAQIKTNSPIDDISVTNPASALSCRKNFRGACSDNSIRALVSRIYNGLPII